MGKELTVRGLIIGVFITLVFTAANVYFGLKAGLTFSTSIPAAVISMALLRGFRDATVQENNIVQTVASAAGRTEAVVNGVVRIDGSHSARATPQEAASTSTVATLLKS